MTPDSLIALLTLYGIALVLAIILYVKACRAEKTLFPRERE